MDVNTCAHFWTVKACLPNMIAQKHGHIVTIASSAGILGVPGLGDYCASKQATKRPLALSEFPVNECESLRHVTEAPDQPKKAGSPYVVEAPFLSPVRNSV